MNHFTDCEEFLEKTAAGPGLFTGARSVLKHLGGSAAPSMAPKAFPSAGKYVAEAGRAAGELSGSLKTPLGGVTGDIGRWFGGLSGLRKGLAVGGGLGLIGLGTTGIMQAMGGDRPGDTLSYKINKGLFGLTDRIRADEQFGEAFSKTLGSTAADTLSELAKDIVGKGVATLKDTLQLSPARHEIFNVLRKEDPDLASADSKTLMEAYHTMSSIAPNLSTDKNAVKSVLRMAVISGGGLDYQTIKGIADAETAINKAQEAPR